MVTLSGDMVTAGHTNDFYRLAAIDANKAGHKPVQVGEALDVQHVDLVDEEHAGDQLGHAVVDVLVDHLRKKSSQGCQIEEGKIQICGFWSKQTYFVYFLPELVRDLRLLGLHQLPHHRQNVLPA